MRRLRPFDKFILLFLSVMVSSSVSSAGDYLVKAGDTLTIVVVGHEGYTYETLVRPDGKISYFSGDIEVAGLTLEQVADRVRPRLNFLKDPVVLVSVKPSSNEVFVFGAVHLPNRYLFQGESISLVRALSLAGGYDQDRADISSIQIIRSNGNREVVNLSSVMEEGKPDVFLRSGDSLYVPVMPIFRVTGYVMQPGTYRSKLPISVQQALSMAGGPIQGEANLRKIVVLRANGDEEEIETDESFWQIEGVMLNEGDTLYVPAAYRYDEINIVGYVRNPGAYKVKGKVTIIEALAIAGGALDRADLDSCVVIHPDGTVMKVDVEELYTHPNPNICLYPGDTLHVPKKFSVDISLILSVLTLISTIVALGR